MASSENIPSHSAGSLSRRPRARTRWKRIGLTVALIFLASAVASTFAVWLYFVEARGLRNVHYADTLTPNGWRRIRSAIGDRALADAATARAANDLESALRLYRIGLAKSPLNAPARIELAQLYTRLGRPDLARDLLVSALPALAGNPEYLHLSLGFLLEFQFDAELRTVAEKLLVHSSRPVRRQAALHAAAIAFYRGDFDGVETLLVSHRLTDSPEGAALLARSDLERGFPELALTRLTPALHDVSARTTALALSAQINAQLGRRPEFARDTALRMAADPLSSGPRLELLRQLHTEGRTSDFAREIDSFFRLFAHDQAALLALGDFGARSGEPDLVRRIQPLFVQHGWAHDATALLFAEACIAAGRHADGLAELDRYLRANPAASTRHGPATLGLRTVALFGLNRDDDARLQLEHFLAQPNLRAENLSSVAARLLAIGRAPAAQLVLTRAVALDPRNQTALTALVRLEAEQHQLDALAIHVRQLLATRRPSRDTLAFVYERAGSDRNLLHPAQPALLAELRPHLARADQSIAARRR